MNQVQTISAPQINLVKSAQDKLQQTATTNLATDNTSAANTRQHIARLESLLLLEGELRNCNTLQELIYCIANDTKKTINAKQVFVLKAKNKFTIEAVSSISMVEKNAPHIIELQKKFNEQLANKKQVFCFDNSKESFCAVPLVDSNDESFAAIVFAKNTVYKKNEMVIFERLQKAFSHAWLSLAPRKKIVNTTLAKKLTLAAACVGFVSLFVPVSLTSLAPTEIVASNPFIVAAPIDGVIENINVEPNSYVEKGDILFHYQDSELKTSKNIAEKGKAVAEAKFRTVRQSAFGSSDGRRQLAVAQSELELANAELAHAVERLNQAVVRAPISGLAVFASQSEWQGRPVAVGERVVEIANEDNVEYRIDLAVSDSIVLQNEAKVKVFLDSNPLSAKHATLHEASYKATKSANENLVYKLYATPQDSDNLRIGSRGTAQIFSKKVALGFYLLRRPLSTIRQFIGW